MLAEQPLSVSQAACCLPFAGGRHWPATGAHLTQPLPSLTALFSCLSELLQVKCENIPQEVLGEQRLLLGAQPCAECCTSTLPGPQDREDCSVGHPVGGCL